MILSSHQPNFLPYMGLFYKVFKADIFVLSDEHQFSKSGMHNFNYIRIGNNQHRVTVPVSYSFGDRIMDVRISYSKDWVSEFLKTLSINYKKASYFNIAYPFFEAIFSEKHEKLVSLNINLFKQIVERMGLKVEIKISHELGLKKKKEERILEMCKLFDVRTYYSGIGGVQYNNPENYKKAGVNLVYSDYKPFPYKQLGEGFIENLSVLDWIFNMGFQIPEEWRN